MAHNDIHFFYIDERLTVEDATLHGDHVAGNALDQLDLDNPNDSFYVEVEEGAITHKTHEGFLFLKFTHPHRISYFSQSREGLDKLILYFNGLPDGFLDDPPADFFVNPREIVGGRRRKRAKRAKRTKRTKRTRRTRRTRRKN